MGAGNWSRDVVSPKQITDKRTLGRIRSYENMFLRNDDTHCVEIFESVRVRMRQTEQLAPSLPSFGSVCDFLHFML